jgi:hypothetical protein
MDFLQMEYPNASVLSRQTPQNAMASLGLHLRLTKNENHVL